MKIRTLPIALGLLTTLALVGCQTTQVEEKAAPAKMATAKAMSPQEAEFQKALAAAKAAQKAAAAVKNEWRDTGKLIKAAEAAAKKGDYAKAIKLARDAEFQGNMAVQQAKEQENAGNPDYLYR